MKDVLEEIVAWKHIEIEQMKEAVSESHLHEIVETMMMEEDTPQSFAQALLQSDTGIIAEFKRRSPSKGWIKQEANVEIIPLDYQRNGAAAVSILADSKYFGGSPCNVRRAKKAGVTIPILYKEFIIDEYQLFQARAKGASAVLLIAAELKKNECRVLIEIAHELGLEVLLEMHSEAETEYAEMEPDVCGINNRNLGTFTTDVNNSFRLEQRLPEGIAKISESGISDAETVRLLRHAGFNGFLIGECFMKADDPGKELKEFISKL